MTIYTDRGSSIPGTSGTWGTTANAYDGTPGFTSDAFATWVSSVSGAEAWIEVGGYDFSTVIGADATLASVSVTVWHKESSTSRIASVTAQAFDGGTAIGSATTLVKSTSTRLDTFTITATLAQLRSSTFKVRVTATRAAVTQSSTFSLDSIDVQADYTAAGGGGGGGAKRVYISNAAAGYTPATLRGTWDVTTAASFSLGDKAGANTTAEAVPGSASGRAMWGRWISEPAKQAGSTAGATMSGVIGAYRSGIVSPYFRWYIYVTAGDTDTVRGVLIADTISAVRFLVTATTGQGYLQDTSTFADVAVQVGDRIVIEFGLENSAGSSGSGFMFHGGTGATDLADLSTACSTNPGWFEFTGMSWFWTAVNEYEVSSWDTTTTPKTVTPTTTANDTLVYLAGTEDFNATVPAPTGTLTYTERQNVGALSRGRAAIFTAPGQAAAGWTLTGTRTGSVYKWGFNALVFPGYSGGPGASVGEVRASVPGTIELTTTEDNSAVAVIMVDWSAINRTERTWATVNGYTPSAANGGELTYFNNTSNYTVYIAVYPDVGVAGAHVVGVTETIAGHSIAAIEVKAPAEGEPPPSFDPRKSSMLLVAA